jgi:hypothetical protein
VASLGQTNSPSDGAGFSRQYGCLTIVAVIVAHRVSRPNPPG